MSLMSSSLLQIPHPSFLWLLGGHNLDPLSIFAGVTWSRHLVRSMHLAETKSEPGVYAALRRQCSGKNNCKKKYRKGVIWHSMFVPPKYSLANFGSLLLVYKCIYFLSLITVGGIHKSEKIQYVLKYATLGDSSRTCNKMYFKNNILLIKKLYFSFLKLDVPVFA